MISTIMCSKDPGYIKRPGELGSHTNTEVYESLVKEFQCFDFYFQIQISSPVLRCFNKWLV